MSQPARRHTTRAAHLASCSDDAAALAGMAERARRKGRAETELRAEVQTWIRVLTVVKASWRSVRKAARREGAWPWPSEKARDDRQPVLERGLPLRRLCPEAQALVDAAEHCPGSEDTATVLALALDAAHDGMSEKAWCQYRRWALTTYRRLDGTWNALKAELVAGFWPWSEKERGEIYAPKEPNR